MTSSMHWLNMILKIRNKIIITGFETHLRLGSSPACFQDSNCLTHLSKEAHTEELSLNFTAGIFTPQCEMESLERVRLPI